MKLRSAALALLIPLAGCSSMYGGAPQSSPYGGRYADAYTPMRARLTSTRSGLGINLNRQAYVAVFQIVPGSGAQLLYPAYSSERSNYSAGYNRLVINTGRQGSYYHADSYSRYARNEPEYFLLVASRHPLNIRALQQRPATLRNRLGYTSFISSNPNAVMEDIVSLVLPAARDEDWDTDVLTVWPDRGYSQYAYNRNNQFVAVRCPNGRTIQVPLYALEQACRRDERAAAPPPARPRPPRDTASDTLDVTVPGRERPGEGDGFANGANERLRPRVHPVSRDTVRPPAEVEQPGRVEPGAIRARIHRVAEDEAEVLRPAPADRHEPEHAAPRAVQHRVERPREADVPERRPAPRREEPAPVERKSEPAREPARVERSHPAPPARVDPPESRRPDPAE